MVKIAIIGDIHKYFNKVDVEYFNASDYDLILISGDLADFRSKDALDIADLLAQLNKPAVLIGGNHDCTSISQFLAEIKGVDFLAQRDGARQVKRVEELKQHLGEVIFAGYSGHDFSIRGEAFTVIAARPFSAGGPDVRIRPYIRSKFGINNVEESIQRLQELVDQACSDRLVFLAHNGPTGLGVHKDSIWGCDFRPEEGDFGDLDLEKAIHYAKEQGKQVSAVIAGHLHHELMGGGQRKWLVQSEGTTYINAARVPRIFEHEEKTVHHYLVMILDGEAISINEQLIKDKI